MLQADSARNRLTGIALVSVCYLLFTLLDGSAKWLVTSVPVIVVVWLRFLTHVLMTGINFWALQYLQLAITSSIFFLVPVLTVLMAAPLLGEKIDAGRWAAIAAGFAGVLVIVRPGSTEFHPAMLLALVNAVLYAIFNLMTRRLAAYDSPETIQYLPAVGAAVLLAPFAIAGWESPAGWLEWSVACLMGALGGLGHYLLALGDVPAPAVWIGAASVIGSGLYLFARERARVAA